MASKIVFVTGGNGGIGFETVKALLSSKQPYHILMGSRSLSKAQEAIGSLHSDLPNVSNTVEAVQLDLTSDDSIEKAFENVETKYGHLDILINNAGNAAFDTYAALGVRLTDAGATFDIEYLRGNVGLRDCFNNAYDVNVAGTHVMTATFVPLLLKSNDPRIIFVAGLSNINQASEKYFPTPPQPAGWPKKIDFETIGYRCSKLALSMIMLDWNHKLQADGVKVCSVGPGVLATNLGNMREQAIKMGLGHPSIGGDIIKRVAEGERDSDMGKIIIRDGILPW